MRVTSLFDSSEFITRMQSALDDLSIQDWKIYHYDEVESTNDIAKELLQKEEAVIVLADVQTKGRGTKGASWASPQGGCWISIGTNLVLPYTEISSLVAKQLVILLSDLIDEDCIHKPPNDVYLDGKKLAGVLVETKIANEQIHQAIVGIGVNVQNNIPEYLEDIATSFYLRKTYRRVSTVAMEVALEVIFLLRKLMKVNL